MFSVIQKIILAIAPKKHKIEVRKISLWSIIKVKTILLLLREERKRKDQKKNSLPLMYQKKV